MTQPIAPVLVTGAHRSGSTWVGKILASAQGTGYLHEPFNKDLRFSCVNWLPEYWFTYVNEGSSEHIRAALIDTIHLHYPWMRNLRRVRNLRNLQSVWKEARRIQELQRTRARPIIKDPIAVFSAPWFAEHQGAQIVVCVRHPAAFAASLKVKQWHFDFQDLWQQEALMELPAMQPFRDRIHELAINKNAVPIHVQAAALWNCIYGYLAACRIQHPEWHFIRNEDLSLNPQAEFERLFAFLNLPLTTKVRNAIHTTSTNDHAGGITRNSAENIWTWQQRLSPDEIHDVREQTAAIGPLFYSDQEWSQPSFRTTGAEQ